MKDVFRISSLPNVLYFFDRSFFIFIADPYIKLMIIVIVFDHREWLNWFVKLLLFKILNDSYYR